MLWRRQDSDPLSTAEEWEDAFELMSNHAVIFMTMAVTYISRPNLGLLLPAKSHQLEHDRSTPPDNHHRHPNCSD